MTTHDIRIGFALLAATAAAGAGPRPNVLFVLTEDQGAHLGALGTPAVQTPHADALAESGTLFRRAYVNYPVCSASKACLMTGLYPHVNGLRNNTNNFFKPAARLSDRDKRAAPYKFNRVRSAGPTLIESLHRAGYHTAVTGKLHLAPNERFPYDEFLKRRPFGQAVTEVARLAKRRGKPWLLLHNSITFTHRPFVNSGAKPIGVDPAKVNLPAHLPDTPTARRDWAEYLDAVERNDAALGRVLAGLKRAGRADDTIVIYMGDHGPAYQHGKMSPYSLGLHVPLIVRVPGLRPRETDALVSEIDLMPTLLDLLGIGYAAPLNGVSLRPLIEGKPGAKGHEYVFAEVTGRRLNRGRGMEERSVIGPRYHLIERTHLDARRQVNADLVTMKPWRNRIYAETIRAKGRFPAAYRVLCEMHPTKLGGRPPAVELYDLQADPDELHNLAADPARRGDLGRLRGALAAWRRDTDDRNWAR